MASRMLASILPVFPPGTIHSCVVDPGVGGDRCFLLVRTQGQTIIAPDNGLISSLLQTAEGIEIREMSETWFRRIPFSSTFHGRDLVAPAAGHLAAGIPPERFGPVFSRNPLRIEVPRPSIYPWGVKGEVVDIDHFGNLLTNITPDDWNGHLPNELNVIVGNRTISQLLEFYSQAAEGELLTLISSFETLEIACRNGNAATLLGAFRGMSVELRFGSRNSPG